LAKPAPDSESDTLSPEFLRGGVFGYTLRVIPRDDLPTSVAELGL
jgi:hypothetical protein